MGVSQRFQQFAKCNEQNNGIGNGEGQLRLLECCQMHAERMGILGGGGHLMLPICCRIHTKNKVGVVGSTTECMWCAGSDSRNLAGEGGSPEVIQMDKFLMGFLEICGGACIHEIWPGARKSLS